MNHELFLKRLDVEKNEDWDVWVGLPRLKLKEGWEIQLVPPFGGAICRALIWSGDKRVSIYFDALDRIGSVGSPYWEIYPDENGDNARFYTQEVDKMLEAIDRSFNSEANAAHE